MPKEREAIEIVEGIVKSYIEADECGLSNNDFKHEIRALQTVLNMLKDLQKENKYMHSELDRQQTTINNYAKEIEKKEKIIDLMAITIIQRDIGENYCQFGKKCCKCEDGSRDFNCKNCIKRYYEGQVKE